MNNTTFSLNVLRKTQPTTKEEVVFKLHKKLTVCQRIIESEYTSIEETETAFMNKKFYLEILSVL